MSSSVTRSPPMNQAMVEHLTGFSREVLRKWELRYGFPAPARGAKGQRLYTHADVDKLLLLRRLLHAGLRPSQVVHLEPEALQKRLDALRLTPSDPDEGMESRIAALLSALTDPLNIDSVQALLGRWLYLDGPLDFARFTLAQLNEAIGDAWADGRLSIHQEHWYAERMRRVLNAARMGCVPDRRFSRILLTTPPGESHELALLGLELALATQGVDALYLGAQTPVDEVCQAAARLGAEAVALSVSIGYNPHDLLVFLQRACGGLPPDCAVWVGGKGVTGLGVLPSGIFVFETIQDAVLHWQRIHRPA